MPCFVFDFLQSFINYNIYFLGELFVEPRRHGPFRCGHKPAFDVSNPLSGGGSYGLGWILPASQACSSACSIPA